MIRRYIRKAREKREQQRATQRSAVLRKSISPESITRFAEIEHTVGDAAAIERTSIVIRETLAAMHWPLPPNTIHEMAKIMLEIKTRMGRRKNHDLAPQTDPELRRLFGKLEPFTGSLKKAGSFMDLIDEMTKVISGFAKEIKD